MTNPDYIDQYFKKELSPEEVRQFEQRIEADPAFAEETAFYFGTMQLLKEQGAEEKKQHFRKIYKQQNNNNNVRQMPAVRWLRYAAAAAVIGFIAIGSYFYFKPAPPNSLADKFITEELQQLPVNMDTREDSMKTGASLYNHKEFSASLKIFESLAQSDKSNTDAKYNAGIVSLQLQDYDKALKYFEELENYKGMETNPGKFYRALTLMKRNQSGDKELARQLLHEVDQQSLAGKKQAEEWLKKF